MTQMCHAPAKPAEKQERTSPASAYFVLVRSVPYMMLTICMTALIILERLVLNVSDLYATFGSRIWHDLFVLSLDVSAISSVLTVFFMWLAPASQHAASFAIRLCSVLIKAKQYAWYAITAFVGITYGYAVGRVSTGQMDSILLTMFGGIVPVALAFIYALVLRSIAIIAADAAKVIRTGEYQHSFGHSCGLIWQSILLFAACLLMIPGKDFAFMLIFAMLPDFAYVYGMELIAIWEKFMPVLLAVLGVKFLALACLYPRYMKAANSSTRSAIDTLMSNTPEGASPIHTRRH